MWQRFIIIKMVKSEKACIYQSEDGYLYMPGLEVNIQKEYKPIIEEVSVFFKKLGNKNIHSVYLRGSIVCGLGIKDRSDVDFFIITLKPLTDFDWKIIKKHMDDLNKKYPFVTRFDLSYFVLDQIFSAKENVLIKLNSICIYGKDIKDKIKNPRPGKDVTISLSLLEEEMLKTRNEIKRGLYNETNTKAMCLWIMKRIVRSGLEIVSEREGCFTRDLAVCFDKFSKHYLDKRDDMHKALSLALKPTSNTKLIEGIFENIGNWLVVEGKRLKLIPLNDEDINKIVIKKITSLFDKSRIICLLRYGPKVRSDGSPPTDFDFLLLLEEYKNNDYLLLSCFKKLIPSVEVFIDYKDQILSKGIKNYQRGCHGSYFFKILSSAETLLGDNFYKENEKYLDNNKISLDLLYRVEEYFYRIQKEIINKERSSKIQIEKYLGRILTDLMLVTGEIQFQDMHNYHYTYIMSNIIESTNMVSTYTKNQIIKFLSNPILDIKLLSEIVGTLYGQYLKIRQNIIK